MNKALNVLIAVFLSASIVFISMYFIHKNQGDNLIEALYIGIIAVIGLVISFGLLQYLKRKKSSEKGF